MERDSGTGMEGDPSSSLEEDLDSGMGEGRNTRRTLPRNGQPRLGVHQPRSVEEKAYLETAMEKVLEASKETDLDSG